MAASASSTPTTTTPGGGSGTRGRADGGLARGQAQLGLRAQPGTPPAPRPAPQDARSPLQATTLDDVIGAIGYGLFQQTLLLLCGLGWAADCMWLQGMALLVPQVQRSFALPVAQSGIIISSIFSGMLVGAISWGALSDRVGRKYAFHLTLPVSTLFGLLASIAPTIELLCLAVFGLGFGVGGHMPVDGCLFIEFCPKEHQSKLTFLSVFFQVGAVLSAVIMLTIVSVLPGGSWLGFESWRIVLVAQAAVSLLMFICRCTLIDLRESPKFLLAKDRRSEAVQALEHVAAVNGAAFTFTPEQINSLTLDELVDPGSADQGAEADSETGADTPLLGRPVQPSMFDSKYRTTTLLLFAIWILVALGYTMFNAFIAKFMESKGISTVPQSEFDVYLNCLVYAASAIPSAWIATWLVDTKTFQRRGTLASSAIASSAVLWMFVASSSQLAVLISSSLVNVFSAILYAVIYTYTPEVYPTSIRATANGTCSALGRIAGIFSPLVGGALMSISLEIPLHVSASAILLSGICALLLPIETRVQE